jgi:hypothetical protein
MDDAMSTKVALVAGAMFALAMSMIGPSDAARQENVARVHVFR